MVEKKFEENEQADNNTFFYCIQCGTKLKKTSDFCKNCGFKINSTQENINYTVPNNQTYHNQSRYVKNSYGNDLEWKPIVIGGVIAVVVSVLLGFFIGFLLWDADISTILGATIIGNMASLFIGGLYAGVKARKSGGMHGAYAGATCAIISIPVNLLLGMPVDIGSSFFAVLLAMLFAGIGGLVGYWITKSSKIQPRLNTQTYYG